jgi:uroporphyrinogen decarboxylase
MTKLENWRRCMTFQGPEWIPCGVGFSPLTWATHRERLEEVCLRHPKLFPGFRAGERDFDDFPVTFRVGERHTDNWGCVWEAHIPGLEGQVVVNPIADWDALDAYQMPDPSKKGDLHDLDWAQIRTDAEAARKRGERVYGFGERLFDRLYFLRGFENLMVDIATDDPHLPVLIERFTQQKLEMVRLWTEIGVDAMAFHTDIGTQKALMISPEKFRKYIKPMFARIFGACHEAGAMVNLSSDGNLLEIVDDLIECGVNVHDPQLRACTIDGIVRAYKGKMCANVDLDRQMFAFCTPEDITSQIREVVEKMHMPEGGLMVSGSVWDDITPIENIEALCVGLEEFCLGGMTE